MPASLEKDENEADVRDAIRSRRQNKIRTASPDSLPEDMKKFKTAIMNDARMADDNFPDIEILFSDLERYEKESSDHRQQPVQNNAVNFEDQTLLREQRATPNYFEPKDKDEESFNIQLLFFPWQSDTSKVVHSKRQIAGNGSESLFDRTLLREQRATPKIETRDNDEGVFDVDRVLLDLFWPQSEKDLMHEAKPTDQIGAMTFVDQSLSRGRRAVTNIRERDNNEGVFNLFWPQSEKKELGHDEKQDNQIGAMKFVDQTLLRGRHVVPNIGEQGNDEGVFNLERVLDHFWPQSEKKELGHDEKQDNQIGAMKFVDPTLLRGQRAAPNVEERDSEGVFNLEGELDFSLPQSEKKIQYLQREQRNVSNNEPWNNEGRTRNLKPEQQDFSWPQSFRTESLDYDTEQVDQNGDVHFADHTLFKQADVSPYVEARDTEEGATEPTSPPNEPSHITYESNVMYFFLTITMPSFIGISLTIILCCFCLRTDGYCCRLFDARPPDVLEEDANDFGQDNWTVKKIEV